MAIVISDGKTAIGAFWFQDEEKPCLCMDSEDKRVRYGVFDNDKAAKQFMEDLAGLIGVQEKEQ